MIVVVVALELVATVAVELVAAVVARAMHPRERFQFLHRHFPLTVLLELVTVIMAAVLL